MIQPNRPFKPLRRLVIATHNAGKLREFAALLDPYANEIVSSGDLGLPEPEETGASFADNAILKAHAASKSSGEIVLADDSGLCVAALNGVPGIHSARWAGPGKDFAPAMERINRELGASENRAAHFACVLALAFPDGRVETVEGRVDGRIIWPPRGKGGHGYDPIFVPNGFGQTFAEMDDKQKNALSHRGKAVQALIDKVLA
jgi:XTP/dITP diphosphohydrolase